MSLLVYFPGSLGRVHNADLLTTHGLDALVDRSEVRSRDRGLFAECFTEVAFADVLDNGPDQGCGILCGLNVSEALYMDLANQAWFPCQAYGDKPAGHAYVGWFKRNPPTPDNCARREQRPGEALILADGNEWTVPCVLDLPQTVGFDAHGNVVTKGIVPKHRPYADAADVMLAKFTADFHGANVGVDHGEAIAFAVLALQQNYRITREVVLALELFDTGTLWQICDLANGVGRQVKAATAKLEEMGIELEGEAVQAA